MPPSTTHPRISSRPASDRSFGEKIFPNHRIITIKPYLRPENRQSRPNCQTARIAPDPARRARHNQKFSIKHDFMTQKNIPSIDNHVSIILPWDSSAPCRRANSSAVPASTLPSADTLRAHSRRPAQLEFPTKPDLIGKIIHLRALLQYLRDFPARANAAIHRSGIGIRKFYWNKNSSLYSKTSNNNNAPSLPRCPFFNKPPCSCKEKACYFVRARQTFSLPPSGCGNIKAPFRPAKKSLPPLRWRRFSCGLKPATFLSPHRPLPILPSLYRLWIALAINHYLPFSLPALNRFDHTPSLSHVYPYCQDKPWYFLDAFRGSKVIFPYFAGVLRVLRDHQSPSLPALLPSITICRLLPHFGLGIQSEPAQPC